MTDLALLSDHPLWSRPLFVAAHGAGLGDRGVRADGRAVDPAARPKPAPVALHRIAMPGFLCSPPAEEMVRRAGQLVEPA